MEESRGYGGPFKATHMWNDVTRDFRGGMPVSRHRLQLRSYPDSFTGPEAVSWLLEYLRASENFGGSAVTRKQASLLLVKLQRSGLFEDVRGEKFDLLDITDTEGRLFRFTNCALEDLRLPLANRSTLLNRSTNQNARRSYGDVNEDTADLKNKSYRFPLKLFRSDDPSYDIENLPPDRRVGEGGWKAFKMKSEPRSSSEQRKKIKAANDGTAALSGTSHMSAKRSQSSAPSVENVLSADQSESKYSSEDLNLAFIEPSNKQNHTNKKSTANETSGKKLYSSPTTDRKAETTELVVDDLQITDSLQHGRIEPNDLVDLAESKHDVLNDSLNIQVPSLEEGKYNMRDVFKFSDSERKSAKIKFSSQAKENIQSDLNIYEERAVDCEVSSYSVKKSNDAEATKNKNKIIFNETVVFDKKSSRDPFKRLFGGVVNKNTDTNHRFDALPDQFDKSAWFKRKNSSRTRSKKGQDRRSAGAVLVTDGIYHDGFFHGGISSDNCDFLNEHMQDAWNVRHCPGYATDVQAVKKSSREIKSHKKTNGDSARTNDVCNLNSVHFSSKSLNDESKHARKVGLDSGTVAWDGNAKYSDSSIKVNSGSTHMTNNEAKIEKYSDVRKYSRYSVESLINTNNSYSFYYNDNNYDIGRNEGRNFVIVGSTIPRNNVEKLHTSSKSFDIVHVDQGKVNTNKTRSDFPTTLTYYRRTDSRSHSVDNRKEDCEVNRALLRGKTEDYVTPAESGEIAGMFDVMTERNRKIGLDNKLQIVEKREGDGGVMHKSRSKSKRKKVAKALENPLRENFMKGNPMMKKDLENPMRNNQLENPLMNKPMISRLLMERQYYTLPGYKVSALEYAQGLNAGLEQRQELVTKSTKKNGGIIRDHKTNHVSFGSNTSQLSGQDWNFTGDSSTLQASNISGINQSLNNSNGKRDSFVDRQSDCSLEVSQAEISQLLPLARKLLPGADEHCLEVAVQQTIIERQRARSQSLSSRDRSVSVSKRNSSVVEGKTFGAIVETGNCEEKCCKGCDRKSAEVLDDVKRRVCKQQLVKRLEKMVSRKDTLSNMIGMDAISADNVARNLKIELNGDCGATYHADSNDKGKEDTLPEWLVEALKYLAKWPESDEDGSSCVGFEEELLKVVTDYLSIQDPLFNDSHYKFLIKALESISRDSMSTLTSVMKCPHQQGSHKPGLSPVSYQSGLSDSTVIQLNTDTPASLTENQDKTGNTSTDLISLENKSVQGQYCINKEHCSHNQDVLPHYQHVKSEDNLVTADAALLSTSLKNLNGDDGNKAARNVLKGSVEVEGLARKKDDSKPLIKRRSLSALIGLRKRRDKSKRTWEKLTSNDALDSTRDIDQKSISIPDLAQLARSMPDISQINTDNSDKLSLASAQSTGSDECERKAKRIAEGMKNSDDMPDIVKTAGIKRKLSARNSNTSGSVEENFVNKEASALNINKIIDFLDPNSPNIVDFATAFGPGYRFDATVDGGVPTVNEIKEERHRWHFPSLKRSRSRKRNNVVTEKVSDERRVEAGAETTGEACGDVKNLKSKSESSGLSNSSSSERNNKVLCNGDFSNSSTRFTQEGIIDNTHADSNDLSEGFTNFVHINPSNINTEEFYPTLSYRKKSICGFGAGNRIGSLRKPVVVDVGLSNVPNDLIGDLKECEEFSSKSSLEIEEPLLLAETDYSELMKCLDNLCIDRVVSPKDTSEEFKLGVNVEENKKEEISNVLVKQKEGVYCGMESNLTNISEGIFCAKFEGGDGKMGPIKKSCHELALQYSMSNRGDAGKVKRTRSRYSKWNSGSKSAQKLLSSSSDAMKCDVLYTEMVINSNGNAPVTENIISSDLVTNSDKNASDKCNVLSSEDVINSNEKCPLNSATLMSEDNFEESDNLVELLSILAHMCEVCKPLENQDFCEIFWRCVETIQLCCLVLEPRAYETFMSTLRLFGKVYCNRNLAIHLGAADNKLTNLLASHFFSYHWMKVTDTRSRRYGNESVADRYGNEAVAETLLQFLLLHHSKITRSPSRLIRLVEEAIQKEVTDGCHPVSCCLHDTQPDQNNKLNSTYRVSTSNHHPSYQPHRFECTIGKENVLPSEGCDRFGSRKTELVISSISQCKLMHQTGSILSQSNQQTGTNQSTGNGKSLEEEKIKKRRSRTPSVLKKPLLHLQSMRF